MFWKSYVYYLQQMFYTCHDDVKRKNKHTLPYFGRKEVSCLWFDKLDAKECGHHALFP